MQPFRAHSPAAITEPPQTSVAATVSDGLGPHICRREETVSKLAERLAELNVVHVRGTPSSGKTILALLLAQYYETRGLPFVFLPGWKREEDDPIDTCIKHYESKYGAVGISRYQFLHSSNETVFIIDEAQESYEDIDFWSHVIKAKIGQGIGLRFCLFSSYGSPSTGRPQNPKCTPIGLFYTEQEFMDAVERQQLALPGRVTFPLDNDARAYLFSVTNGHPAAVTGLFEFVYHTYRSDIKQGQIKQIDKSHVARALEDDVKVFHFLATRAVSRSFPRKDILTIEAAQTLRRTLIERSIPFDKDDPGLDLCLQMGWLHSGAKDLTAADVFCVFPSRVHEKYVEIYLSSEYERRFPTDVFPTLGQLCMRVLENFSKSQLQLGCRGRITTSGKQSNPEAQFQDEFYRSLTALVGHGVRISSEWSRGDDGRIDFRILEPKWGVELLRDGDRLAEHCRRFTPTGTYGNWIQEKHLKDWLILDCRHSDPKPTPQPESKLWRVVFKQNYTSAVVLDSKNDVIIPEFPLLS
ncbi:hypothetical protein AJ79_08401 [Helicocarpus griseus UAMH5409]|uniref:Uncharacterized protein n=1 Tax=Helicocarpus griseus UAMH5409 TaxID=1447875 RepID=A0A2B7WTC8_9EURO|nr:hypothetical protein AJ79_08401 [Helicocarpus griseus UAMH5409]